MEGVQGKWWIFLALALSVMMVDLDMTAVNLAVVTMAKDLSLSLGNAQWIIDGYMIAAAALMTFSGRLSDTYGTRPIFLSGLAVFTVASLVVALSTGAVSVIASRIIQGACVAFIFPIAAAIVHEIFPKEQQGLALGSIVAIAGFSQAIGPTFGGLMVHFFSWRWIFFIDVPLTIFSLLIAYKYLPKKLDKPTGSQLNYTAVTLFCIGLFALMIALNEVGRWGYTSILFIGFLSVGIISLTIFTRIELKSGYPLLDIHLLSNSNFRFINIARLCMTLIYLSLLFTLSLLLQNVLDYSALDAGFILLAMTLVFGVLSMPAGKLIDSIGPKWPMQVGMLCILVCVTMLAMFTLDTKLAYLLIALVFAGVGIALFIPASATGLLFSVPPEKAGSALGIFFTNGFVGSSLGVALSGLLLHHFSLNKLSDLLKQASIVLTDSQQAIMQQAVLGSSSIHTHLSVLPPSSAAELTLMTKASFLAGFTMIMWLGIVLASISSLLICRLHFPKLLADQI